MKSTHVCFGVTIIGLFISNALSLPENENVNFGGKTNANRNTKVAADVNPRFGLVASVLGKR